MKHIRYRLCALGLLFVFSLSGCAQVIELTDEQQDDIAFYSAGVISKFNKRQGMGIVPVVMTPPEEETTEEEETDEEVTTSGGGVDSEAGETTDGGSKSLTDIAAIPGLSFTYKGAQAMESFVADGYSINPQPGKQFLCLTFTAKNDTAAEMACDIASRGMNFSATLSSVNANVQRTVLENDFTTYNGSLAPGGSVDLVMLFEFSPDALGDLTNISVIGTKNGIRSQLKL